MFNKNVLFLQPMPSAPPPSSPESCASATPGTPASGSTSDDAPVVEGVIPGDVVRASSIGRGSGSGSGVENGDDCGGGVDSKHFSVNCVLHGLQRLMQGICRAFIESGIEVKRIDNHKYSSSSSSGSGSGSSSSSSKNRNWRTRNKKVKIAGGIESNSSGATATTAHSVELAEAGATESRANIPTVTAPQKAESGSGGDENDSAIDLCNTVTEINTVTPASACSASTEAPVRIVTSSVSSTASSAAAASASASAATATASVATDYIHYFEPHITIMKTSADRKNGRKLKITRDLYISNVSCEPVTDVAAGNDVVAGGTGTAAVGAAGGCDKAVPDDLDHVGKCCMRKEERQESMDAGATLDSTSVDGGDEHARGNNETRDLSALFHNYPILLQRNCIALLPMMDPPASDGYYASYGTI